METVYNVTARYRAQTGQANSQLRQLTGQTRQLSDQARQARDMLRGLGTGLKVALGTGMAVAVGWGVRRMGQLNKMATEAKATLASVFTLNDLGDFTSNMRRATGLLEKFRDAAKGTPGSGQDITTLIAGTLPALAKINPGDNELARFGRGTLAAGNVLMPGANMQEVSQSMLQILSGQGGVDNRLFNALRSPLFEQLGITASGTAGTQQFNKVAQSDPRKLFNALMTVMEDLEGANKVLGDSIAGQWEEFSDNVDTGLRSAAAPVFDFLKRELKNVNRWFSENENKVQRIGKAIGGGMTAALKLAAGAAELLADNLALALTAAGGLAAYQAHNITMGIGALISESGFGGRVKGGVSKVLAKSGAVGGAVGRTARNPLGAILGFAGDFMFGNSIGAGKGMGAKLARTKAPRPISGIANFLTAAPGAIWRAGMSNPGDAIDKLEGKRKAAGGMMPLMFGGAKAKLAPLLGSMGAFLKVAGPLAIAVMALVGAFQVLQDDTLLVTKVFWEAIDGLLAQLDMLAMKLGTDGIVDLFSKLTKSLGEGLVWALTFVTTAVTKVVEGFNWLGFILQALGGMIGELVMQWERGGGGLMGLKNLDFGQAFNKGLAFAEEQRRKQEEAAAKKREKRRKKREDDKDKAAKDGPAKTDIKVELVQHNYEARNPDRIAYRSMELLGEAFTNKRLSAISARSRGK